MMALMEWSDKYSVGINSIDVQHKQLVALINNLFEALSKGKGDQALAPILNELIVYTKTHFAYEERLFTQYAYPDSSLHKADHDKLAAQVLDIQKQMQEGKVGVSVGTMTFLKEWLSGHIMGSDKKYGPYLSGKGVV
jgi:hemerythrin